MFDRSKPKIGCSSSIANKWTRSSSFDVRKMMFEFDRCSIKWCSTHHWKLVTLFTKDFQKPNYLGFSHSFLEFRFWKWAFLVFRCFINVLKLDLTVRRFWNKLWITLTRVWVSIFSRGLGSVIWSQLSNLSELLGFSAYRTFWLFANFRQITFFRSIPKLVTTGCKSKVNICTL